MNTQTLLFENSKDIPEGLYIKLMDALKKDFENNNISLEKKLEILFNGYYLALQDTKEEYDMNLAMKYLKDMSRNKPLIRQIWGRFYEDEDFDEYYNSYDPDHPFDIGGISSDEEIDEYRFNIEISCFDPQAIAFRHIFYDEPIYSIYPFFSID